jgi:hypothetical protein
MPTVSVPAIDPSLSLGTPTCRHRGTVLERVATTGTVAILEELAWSLAGFGIPPNTVATAVTDSCLSRHTLSSLFIGKNTPVVAHIDTLDFSALIPYSIL